MVYYVLQIHMRMEAENWRVESVTGVQRRAQRETKRDGAAQMNGGQQPSMLNVRQTLPTRDPVESVPSVST